MATNLNLDDRLVEQARALGHHATKREAVDAALREYVAHLRRLLALENVGTYDFDDDPDYDEAGRVDRPTT